MRRLLLPAAAAEAIRAHEAFSLPDECCGLLAGLPGVVRFVYPLTNANPSPASFTIDPFEHFHSWRHASASNWDLIGAFHSHPSGPSHPSKTDLALANEPEWTYLIVTKGEISGWAISDRKAAPIALDLD
jgi:proteasome lid subunit RPN8/RPN11